MGVWAEERGSSDWEEAKAGLPGLRVIVFLTQERRTGVFPAVIHHIVLS